MSFCGETVIFNHKRPMDIKEKRYSPSEVAGILQVTTYTVRKWIKSRKIDPVIRMGPRVIQVPKSTIEAFLKEHSTQKEGEAV